MRSLIHQGIQYIAHKIYHHQNIRKRGGQQNYHLDFVIYDDSIAIMIEDDSGAHTFLIDNFNDYMMILNAVDTSQ